MTAEHDSEPVRWIRAQMAGGGGWLDQCDSIYTHDWAFPYPAPTFWWDEIGMARSAHLMSNGAPMTTRLPGEY